MDIANINALTRPGSYPVSRKHEVIVPRQDAVRVARIPQPPAEPVLQGELLQKRRAVSSGNTVDLLDSMRAMDRVMRDTNPTGADSATPRDTRRAIASYIQQATLPNTLTGASAAVAIDYFV